MVKKNVKYLDKTDKPYLWYIEWEDHVSFAEGGWQSMDRLSELKPIIISTIGWVFAEEDNCIKLTPTHGTGGETYGTMAVLKKAIVKAVKLSDPIKWNVEKKDAVHRQGQKK